MSTEPYHVWYSEIDIDNKVRNRKCSPFGNLSEAKGHANHLMKHDYIENVVIQQKEEYSTSMSLLMYFTKPVKILENVKLNFTIQ